MLTQEELDALRAAIPGDSDRAALLDTIRDRAAPVAARLPVVPRVKALLSRAGGVCPEDGAALRFDPWSPDRHQCGRCGQWFTGERHHGHWARAQHLWLAERMAEQGLLSAVTGSSAARALELYASYDTRYFELPNRDNVLGPSHLFFSTYLESLWITSYLAGAWLLRESGRLPDQRVEGINRVADEAASLIGEFNEGLSNRQTWHAAALTAIAAWFGDEELGRIAVESRTGLLGHLTDGFAEDGAWWEGENYHLFALRGLLTGLHWSRTLGYDLLDDPVLSRHFRAALLAPARTALPDGTYPARRDSRYGVSLAQPASLELWETGRAWLAGDPELDAWVAALYRLPPGTEPGLLYDAWLHDAGRPFDGTRRRAALSWWALTTMTPAPESPAAWTPASALLPDQGLAVLRRGDRYASLECGPDIGGHGHPDRLHLTVHAGGVHWLPDPGTGSYVEPELAWYRSALAHNAPRIDGANAGGADAWCDGFDADSEWQWCRARAGRCSRTLIAGTEFLVDVLEVSAPPGATIDLPWHFRGAVQVLSPGQWEPDQLAEPFVSGAERFRPAAEGPLRIRIEFEPGRELVAWLLAPGASLLRAVAPGLPHLRATWAFLLVRGSGPEVQWLTVLDLGTGPGPRVTEVSLEGEHFVVTSGEQRVRFERNSQGLRVITAGGSLDLGGLRSPPVRRRPPQPPEPEALAVALRIGEPPPLDGTLDGFELDEPLQLESELQYRRSETPYDPEIFRGEAWVNWDGEALYLAVAVSKPELCVRSPGNASLELDNEPEDINSDGLQIYLRIGERAAGVVVIPGPAGTLFTRPVDAVDALPLAVSGGWARTEDGYLVTLRLGYEGIGLLHPGQRIGFDLLINEMQPDRVRRAGQLVWSGHGGWVYLRGDRHDPAEFGLLELG